MPKFVFMPPQDDLKQMFAARLADTLPELEVASPDTDDEAIEAIRDADAACGWVPPAALKAARKLEWLHNPDAGPFFGYYYDELVAHSLTMTNPRGIYFDHISHHILMFRDGAVPGGCHGTWTPSAAGSGRRTPGSRPTSTSPRPRRSSTASAASATRPPGICRDLGMEVIGIEPRLEHEHPYVELRTPDELDAVLPRADFVISTVPHTPETEGTFNAERFKLMKSSAYFINVGRGKVCRRTP